jgi:hypothetical protein
VELRSEWSKSLKKRAEWERTEWRRGQSGAEIRVEKRAE